MDIIFVAFPIMVLLTLMVTVVVLCGIAQCLWQTIRGYWTQHIRHRVSPILTFVIVMISISVLIGIARLTGGGEREARNAKQTERSTLNGWWNDIFFPR